MSIKMRDELSSLAFESPNPERLREVLGKFATGVTVVTTIQNGSPWGVTANSFTAVSLEPPLILVCIRRRSRFVHAVAMRRGFGINVMDEDHMAVVKAFADRARDGSEVWPTMQIGDSGAVFLEGALAYLECYLRSMYWGGDHVICLGEVSGIASVEVGHPLLFIGGRFRQVGPICEMQDELPECWPWA